MRFGSFDKRHHGWRWLPALAVLLLAFIQADRIATARPAERPPNVVIIYADDLGYGDIGSFGATGYRTPNLDRMAAEGTRLTGFYVAQAVCSASRAALLTGAYPNRIGLQGALDHRARHGINANETTLAEALKTRGYATAIFGKWHLGHHPEFLPTRHGFDEYFGLPYSNDMWPNHPERPRDYPELPLIEGEKVVELMPDQTQLTTWYTQRAVRFIERNRAKPFFLYLPHSMPHVPLFVSSKYKGRTERGIFGDVIEEIDWSVGQVMAALKRLRLDDNTLVIFTSDNGPWRSYGDHAGKAGPLREGKGTAFEGGVRVPFLARWPGKIPAGKTVRAPAMTVDLFPTIAKLADAEPPAQRIDGLDIWPLLSGQSEANAAREAYYFYWGRELHAVRAGKWKLHLPHPYAHLGTPGTGDRPGKYQTLQLELSLFDLESDLGETKNLASQHPEIVRQLMVHVEKAREDLGDSLAKREGKNLRPSGRLEEGEPAQIEASNAHRLALAIVNHSPLQRPTRPAEFSNELESAFIRDLPAAWDETRLLDVAFGKRITVARRSRQQWYLACMAGFELRSESIPLRFLPRGQRYRAEIYYDGNEEVKSPARLGLRKLIVDPAVSLRAELPPGGAIAVRFEPIGNKGKEK